MKKNLIFLMLLCTTLSWAGTPTMDGVFDGVGVWGAARSVADGASNGTAGEAFGVANAKRLYITTDANYVYLGAEVTATSWLQFAFLINTKSGGGTTDSWGRSIAYAHTDKPDYVFRGHFGRDNAVNGNDFGNYASFHTWDGAAWANTGVQIVNNGPTYSVADNIPNDYSTANGFIEIRIARTAITAANGPESLDFSMIQAQFIICGDANDHSSYDAVPDDNNASGWNTAVSLSQYSPFVSSVIGVTWLDFFAKAQKNNTVDLLWSTASEKQNSHFEVQRSANGHDWATIGTVKGNGTTAAKNDYTFTDFSPLNNVNYYRLKQVDFDDKFEYSSTKSVYMSANDKKFTVYPNPVSDKLNVVSNSLDTEGVAQVFNMSGSLVKTMQLANNQLIVAELPVGLYQIRLIDRNGATTEMARFVKK
jgi:Secretion system C-terminal sorting domain